MPGPHNAREHYQSFLRKKKKIGEKHKMLLM